MADRFQGYSVQDPWPHHLISDELDHESRGASQWHHKLFPNQFCTEALKQNYGKRNLLLWQHDVSQMSGTPTHLPSTAATILQSIPCMRSALSIRPRRSERRCRLIMNTCAHSTNTHRYMLMFPFLMDTWWSFHADLKHTHRTSSKPILSGFLTGGRRYLEGSTGGYRTTWGQRELVR